MIIMEQSLKQEPSLRRRLLLGLAALVFLVLAVRPLAELWKVNSIGLSLNRYLLDSSLANQEEASRLARVASQTDSGSRSFWRTYGAVAAANPADADFAALQAADEAGLLDRTAVLWFGEVAAATGHWAEAEKAYSRVDASNLLINRAEEAISTGDKDLARNWLQTATRSLAAANKKETGTSTDFMGVVYDPQGEQVRGPGYYARAYFRIGRGFYGLGEMDEAVLWLEHAKAEAATDPPGLRDRQEINFALAQALAAQPVEDEAGFRVTRARARVLVSQALAMGESAWAHVQAAKSLLPHDDRADAITHCEKALALDPLLSEAYLVLGRVLEEDGLTCLARDLYEKGHQQLPADEEILTALALAAWQTMSPKNALPLLEEAAAAKCREPFVHAFLGDCYLELHRSSDARKAYQEGLELTPNAQPLIERLRAMTSQRGTPE